MKRKDRFSLILELIYGFHPNIVSADAYHTGMCVTESGELARTYDLYIQPRTETRFIDLKFKISRTGVDFRDI